MYRILVQDRHGLGAFFMGKIGKAPSHLLRVAGRYHFRYCSPARFRDYLSGEIRLSLGTGSLDRARVKAAYLTGLTELYLSKLKDANVMADQDKIRAELGRFLRQQLEENETHRANQIAERSQLGGNAPFDPNGMERAEANLNEISTDYKHQLKGGAGRHAVDVDGFLQQAGIPPIPKDSPNYIAVKRKLLRVMQDVIKIEGERIHGRYDTQLEKEIKTAYPIPKKRRIRGPAIKPSLKLSDVIEQYIAYHVADDKWKPSSKERVTSRLKLLLEVMGDRSVRRINYSHIHKLKEDLKRLPPYRTTTPAYKELTIKELIALKLPRSKCMGVTTINDIVTAASSLFRWAVKRDLMDKNPAENETLKDRRRDQDKWQAFKLEDLKPIFEAISDPKDMRRDDSGLYWAFLLGLYSGARREEICQLHLEDIRQEGEVWCLDINERHQDTSVKTPESVRLVPIHKELITRGFLDYCQRIMDRGHKRLFYRLKKANGKYGDSIGKKFAYRITKLNLKEPGYIISYRSLRPTFITRVHQLELNRDHVMMITGHTDSSVHMKTYRKDKALIPNLKKTIDRVTFDL